MPDTLRLALLGCGAIARYHLNGIKERVPRVKVTAAIDTDRAKAEAYAAETGAQVFTSYDEALEMGQFDAVDILLPHDLHEPCALKAFAAGKHVLLEKPMAPTLEGCARILEASKKAGTVFMVAENAQYWPEVVKAQEVIQSGDLGEIITARAAFVCEFDEYWFKEKKPWRYEKSRAGGGITIDGGSHWIRPLRMWMGELDEVVAVIGHPLAQMEGESLVRAIFRFQSGAVAGFDAMMVATPMGPEPWWRITGTKGELVLDGAFGGGIRLYDREHRQGRTLMEPQGYAKSFGPELEDFARAVLDGKPLAAGPESALGELRAALAIYRSASSRQWEKVWG
ncbi:MAG: Gfo/Idh/MocA family oxidoreductase [Candidatus Handelsmanbacteria bacterium]|nr:Gfo/Idh/MocA family oxidoreductase [Candidatus Handelsmanbacteria bacterium]